MRIDYTIPEQLESGMIARRLCEQPGFSADPVRQEQRSYHDTFDWRLYASGMVLEEIVEGQQRELVLRRLDTGIPLARTRLTRHAAFARDLPPGHLRDRLAPVLEMRELLPLVTIRARTQGLRLLNKQQKTIARLTIEEGTLQARKGARGRPLPGRVTLLPVKGYKKPVARITRTLEDLQLVPDSRDPALTALAIAGIAPGSYSSKLDLHLEPDMRSDQATRIILSHLLDTMRMNEAGTRKGSDTEFLHDFRVAVRRSRSALGQIKGVLPQPVLARYRREFAWLGQITGPTRDLDVYLLNFPEYRDNLPESMRADLDPLHEFLERHWQSEHAALARALDSARYRRLVDSWQTFLERPVKVRSTLPNARLPIGELASRRIWRVYRRILREGNAIEPDTPAAALHELRKTAKKLRYLMEFFQSLYPARDIKRLIGVLKSLQNNLGDFQDFEVQVCTLKRFSQGMADEHLAPPPTLLAMGMLIEGLERRQHQARLEFAERFGTFSRDDNQARFRALFGPTPSPGDS
jgi:CHAD domain-containing protein